MMDVRECEIGQNGKESEKSYTHVCNCSIVDRVVEKNRESGKLHLLSCRGVVRNKTVCEETCLFVIFTSVLLTLEKLCGSVIPFSRKTIV